MRNDWKSFLYNIEVSWLSQGKALKKFLNFMMSYVFLSYKKTNVPNLPIFSVMTSEWQKYVN